MVEINYPKNRYTWECPWTDKDWLYSEYVVKDRSTKDIAEEYGCKQNTIQCWLAKFKIKKEVKRLPRKEIYPYQNKNYLYEQHIVNKKSMTEIAKENNVSKDTIRYHLIKNNIDYWQSVQKTKYTKEQEKQICDLYNNDKLSANKISKLFNTSHKVIIDIVKRNGFKTRTMSESQLICSGNDINNDLFNDAEWLNNMHWEENKSCKEIGDIIGVDAGTVRRQMKRLGLKTKSNSKSKIGLMTGENHPNWQGGLTSLKQLLREYFNVNQAPKIAKRDKYTCQCCGKTHTILHVHHKKQFHEIVDEIVSENKDLNPDIVEDRLKLYQIITNDKRFLDEDNLITYCKDCHYFKIHKYKRKKED